MNKKGKVKEVKLEKGSYDAVYLGWKQCSSLYGVEVVTPVIHDMMNRPDSLEDLPKVTLGVSRKEIKITQTVTKKPGKTESVKFHAVPMKELMYAARGLAPNDCVVGCVYLGLNEETNAWTHVHCYLCNNSVTADTLIKHLYQYINTPYHKDRLLTIERDLVKKGQITPRPVRLDTSPVDEMGFPRHTAAQQSEPVYETASDIGVGEGEGYQRYLVGEGGGFKLPRGSPAQHKPLQQNLSSTSSQGPSAQAPLGAMANPLSAMVNPLASANQYELEAGPPDYDGANGPDVIESAVAAELRQKLTKGLILLPPKDYDTVKRTHGNLSGIDERRSQNDRIVGRTAANTRIHEFDWSGAPGK